MTSDTLPSPSDLRALVAGPDELAERLAAWVRESANGSRPRLATGWDDLTDYLVPLWGPKLVMVAARSRHGKSSVLKAWARLACEAIAAVERASGAPERGIVYATYEEPIEVIGADVLGWDVDEAALAAGQVDPEPLVRRAIAAASLPLWFVRTPARRADREMPEAFAEYLPQALDQLRRDRQATGGLEIDAVFLDYAQRVPTIGGRTMRERVIATSGICADLARQFRCPVVVAVQAGRDTAKRALEMPTEFDLQESDRLFQDSDVCLALTRPHDWAGLPSEPEVRLRSGTYRIGSSLLLVNVLKQRRGPAGRTFALSLDPVTRRLGYPTPVSSGTRVGAVA